MEEKNENQKIRELSDEELSRVSGGGAWGGASGSWEEESNSPQLGFQTNSKCTALKTKEACEAEFGCQWKHHYNNSTYGGNYASGGDYDYCTGGTYVGVGGPMSTPVLTIN